MGNKLKNLQIYAVMVCLLMAISPLAMAEEIASYGAAVDEDVETEWDVIWQDETGTASVENGDPELVWFVVWGAYWAYTAYTTYDDVKNGDYVSAAIGVTPIGKIGKAGKFFKTTKDATKAATNLGYKKINDYPFDSHGQAVYKKGNKYITPDADGHIGGAWKMFDKKGNRLGTYDENLNRIGD